MALISEFLQFFDISFSELSHTVELDMMVDDEAIRLMIHSRVPQLIINIKFKLLPHASLYILFTFLHYHSARPPHGSRLLLLSYTKGQLLALMSVFSISLIHTIDRMMSR